MELKLDFRPCAPNVVPALGWTDGPDSDVELIMSAVPQNDTDAAIVVCVRMTKEQASQVGDLLAVMLERFA